VANTDRFHCITYDTAESKITIVSYIKYENILNTNETITQYSLL
jgi:hypothetical protein